MDATFTIIVNEMANGDDNFLSDNGTIRREPNHAPTYRDFGNTGRYFRRSDGRFGGARPKPMHSHNHMNRRYIH